jgi:protein-S-isoprenylcysteine O-methyltransferase Ste14
MMMDKVEAAGATPLIACGNFLFRYRNSVFLVVMLALLVSFPPELPGASRAYELVVDVAGLILALAGQALRAAVIGFVYIKRGGLNKRVYANTLVTEGFFGVCRNPLYVGNFLMLAGLLLIHGNPWVIALGMTFFLFAYVSIVAAEEHFLSGKFGSNYSAYCRDVNRWWPDFSRLARSTEGMRFNWQRVVIKDYSTFSTNIATALVLLSYEAVYWHGFAGAQSRLVICGTLLLLLGAAALGIRYAKKSGRLKERAL